MEENCFHITFESGHTKLIDGSWERGDVSWVYFKKEDGKMIYFNIDKVECIENLGKKEQ